MASKAFFVCLFLLSLSSHRKARATIVWLVRLYSFHLIETLNCDSINLKILGESTIQFRQLTWSAIGIDTIVITQEGSAGKSALVTAVRTTTKKERRKEIWHGVSGRQREQITGERESKKNQKRLIKPRHEVYADHQVKSVEQVLGKKKNEC